MITIKFINVINLESEPVSFGSIQAIVWCFNSFGEELSQSERDSFQTYLDNGTNFNWYLNARQYESLLTFLNSKHSPNNNLTNLKPGRFKGIAY